MTSNPLITFVVAPILGWLVLLSLSLVGYLFKLQIREWRRNLRMDAERERLGLRRA